MNFTKISLISIAIILLLSSCSFIQKSKHDVLSEIYSEVMAYGFSYTDGGGNFDYCKDGNLIISSLTEDFRTVTADWQTAPSYFPKLERDTWENFLQANSEQAPIPNDLNLACKYTLLDVKQNPPNQPMENCVVVNFFSQIGFNSSKNQALVSYAQSCGFYSCGSLYFAEFIDDHWVVIDLDEIVCA